MTLMSTCKATLEQAMTYLPPDQLTSVTLVDAKCPIFENIKSQKLCALLMVGLGCDVYEDISGIGPTIMLRKVNKLKNDMANDMRMRENEDALYDYDNFAKLTGQ